MLIRTGESLDDLAQGREHAGPAAALLLGEDLVTLGDQHLNAARTEVDWLISEPGSSPQGRSDRRKQHHAALVEGGHADQPTARNDLDRGVDISHVPPAVAARILHAGAENSAQPAWSIRAATAGGTWLM